MSQSNCVISPAEDVALVRELWRAYWDSLGLADDFQGFAEELESLPGVYAPPLGRLLIAWTKGAPAGTAALRPLGEGSCEIKRLYVRPAYRGLGFGGALLDRLIEEARAAGYGEMFCDTLPAMERAQQMYRAAGFSAVAPYSEKPTPGAVYLRLAL